MWVEARELSPTPSGTSIGTEVTNNITKHLFHIGKFNILARSESCNVFSECLDRGRRYMYQKHLPKYLC